MTVQGDRVNGFYWLIPRVLAGSGRPGGRPGLANERHQLAADLDWLRAQEIGAILSLTEESPDIGAILERNFAHLHIPVADMTPPTPDQLLEALEFIDRQSSNSRPVLVHCLVGQGRTGTVLAAHLIRSGLPPERAIAELRMVCPHAVENERQEQALSDFATRRDWIL